MPSAARALGLTALLCASACVTPVVHPLRVSEGPWVTGSASMQFGAGRGGGCDNFTGCTEGEGGAFGIGLLQAAGGWGHLWSEHFGTLFGLTFPTHLNQKSDAWYSLVTPHAYFAFQTEWAAIGAGGEIGAGGASLIGGLDLRLFDVDDVPVRLGVYGRRFWPFEEEPSPFDGFDGRVKTLDVGVRLTAAFFFAQWSYYEVERGFVEYVVWETSGFSEALHIVSIGLVYDGDARAVIDPE